MKKLGLSSVSLSVAVQNVYTLVSSASAEDFEAGLSWYSKAHSEAFFAATAAGVDFELFCKLVAVLSPSTKWETNIKAVTNLVNQFKAGTDAEDIKPTGTRYYQNQKKGFALLSGETELKQKGSPKTFAFYQNIFNPAGSEFITVDFHIYNAVVGGKCLWETWQRQTLLNRATYDTAAAALRIVAEQFQILPLQAQAITWLSQKATFPGR